MARRAASGKPSVSSTSDAAPIAKQQATTGLGPKRSAARDAASAPSSEPPLSTSRNDSEPFALKPARSMISGSQVLSEYTSINPVALISPSTIVGSRYQALNSPANPSLPAPADVGSAALTGAASGSSMPVRSDSARASSMRPRAASQATDSGILNQASGSSVTTGSAPIQNRPRHPTCCISSIASSAASRLPSGMPPLLIALIVFLRPLGAYSETSAAVVASSEPMPRPVAKRSQPNTADELAIAVSAMPAENHAYDSSRPLRRPRRSPTVPASRAPTITPTSA